jgi:hypothetical protein
MYSTAKSTVSGYALPRVYVLRVNPKAWHRLASLGMHVALQEGVRPVLFKLGSAIAHTKPVKRMAGLPCVSSLYVSVGEVLSQSCRWPDAR